MKHLRKIFGLDVESDDIFLFVSELIFMLALSIVPSMFNIISISQSVGDVVLDVMVIISFAIVIILNFIRWIKSLYIYNGLKRYYIINTSALILYMAFSVVFLELFNDFTYMIVFNSHRIFEVLFNTSLIVSVVVTNAILMIAFAVGLYINVNRFKKREAILKATRKDLNPSKEYDIDSLWKKDIYKGRTKDNKPITDFSEDLKKPDFSEFSSAKDEYLWKDYLEDLTETDKGLIEEYRKDIEEREKLINPYVQYDENHMWENIDNIKHDNITDENDIDKSINPSHEYSPESLWDMGIYEGRCNANTPVTDFSEDLQKPDFSEFEDKDNYLWRDNLRDNSKIDDDLIKSYQEEAYDSFKNRNNYDEYEADSLWDNVDQMAERDISERDIAESINPNKDYDTDSLWSKDMYVGKKRSIED